MTIGQKIKEIREARHMTQMQVANITNLTRQRVQAIEHGTGCPLIPTLMRVSEALGCSLLDLINEPLELGLPERKIDPEAKKPTDYPCTNAEKCPFFKKRG